MSKIKMMSIQTTQGIVAIANPEDVEELRAAAKSLGIKGYQLAKTAADLIGRIKKA